MAQGSGMRYSRIFLRAEGDHFHVVSRIVGRAFLLGEKEKRVFHKLMRRLERWGGVQVLSYCLMDNHVHLLLRTEQIEGEEIGDEELVRRVRGFYSKAAARELAWKLDHWRRQKNRNQIKFWRERYLSRLGNLSEFMRVLKNIFSKWYNAEHERTGTLWEDRYKVVLVQDSEAVLTKIAAYIDLNPVRAGMVGDPGDYRWSGYGEARRGGREARAGIGRMMGAPSRRGWRDAGPWYREVLFSESVIGGGRSVRDSVGGSGKNSCSGARGEEAGLGEMLLRRVRYLTDGVVIGSREFVDRVFKAQPESVRKKRKTGARKMVGRNWNGLFALRDLKVDVFGKGVSPSPE